MKKFFFFLFFIIIVVGDPVVDSTVTSIFEPINPVPDDRLSGAKTRDRDVPQG